MNPEKRPHRNPRRLAKSLAVGRKSCYVCVHRLKAELTAIDKEKAIALAIVRANYVETEQTTVNHGGTARGSRSKARRGRARPVLWLDWYRIPLPRDDSLDEVRCTLRAAGIHDGPYWGCGREFAAGGSGETPVARKIHSAKLREMAETFDYRDLLTAAFGATWELPSPIHNGKWPTLPLADGIDPVLDGLENTITRKDRWNSLLTRLWKWFGNAEQTAIDNGQWWLVDYLQERKWLVEDYLAGTHKLPEPWQKAHPAPSKPILGPSKASYPLSAKKAKKASPETALPDKPITDCTVIAEHEAPLPLFGPTFPAEQAMKLRLVTEKPIRWAAEWQASVWAAWTI